MLKNIVNFVNNNLNVETSNNTLIKARKFKIM